MIHIRQIITNILTNAVKYTQKGSVTLFANSYEADGKTYLVVSVKDTGIGIKEEDIDKLFSSFERIEEKRNRSIEGTGLGMSITKQLLDMMGGDVAVISDYGKGSTFTVEIPQTVIDNTPIGKVDVSDHTSRLEFTKDEIVYAPSARLLIVDDVKLNIKVMNGLLKKTEAQVECASSGMECLEMMNKEKFDMVFLDHMMPEMDGIETLKMYKESGNDINRDTPVIALTANAILGAKEMYLESGFDSYLSKPVMIEELMSALRSFLPKEKIESRE